MTNQNTYDSVNRLTGRLSSVASGGGRSAVSFNYQYKAASQRARPTLIDANYCLYGYDAQGQLPSANNCF